VNGSGLRRARRPYHHGNLKPALVRAARFLLESEGLDALTLRATARRVGVSQTAPYRHFASKEAILAEVARNGFRELAAAVVAAKREAGDDLFVHVCRQAVAYVRFAVDNPALYRLMFGPELERAQHPPLAEEADRAFKLIEEAIIAGQRATVFRHGSPRHAATAVWASLHGLSQLLLDGQFGRPAALDVETLTTQLVETLLSGLKKREVGSRS
jgi:AcrR family transcriptional regulator